MAEFKIDPDYVEVAQRIDDLYGKCPNAVLQGSWTIEAFGANAYIVYTAECWREPDDPRPSVGIAMEEIPGRTPYTKGSEIQNAETSAWGRAIVAAGASRSKKIASADEIRSSQARQEAEPRTAAPADVGRVDQIKADVLALEIQGWVKEQQFGWPWSVEEAEIIERKIASEREKLGGTDREVIDPDSSAAGAAAAEQDVIMSRAESLTKDPLGDLAKLECEECGMTNGQHRSDCSSPF